MSSRTADAASLSAATEAGCRELVELIDFADQFTLVVLFATDPESTFTVRERIRSASEAQNLRFRELVIRPWTPPEDAVAQLLLPEERAKDLVAWFEATDRASHTAQWWRTASRRLNERREVLRRGAMRVLCLVMPLEAKPVVRTAASDLWSIVMQAFPLSGATTPRAADAHPRHATPRSMTPEQIEAIIESVDSRLAAGESEMAATSLLVAVEGYQGLAQASGLYQPELAGELVRISRNEWAHGNRLEALAPLIEAMSLIRKLNGPAADPLAADLLLRLNTALRQWPPRSAEANVRSTRQMLARLYPAPRSVRRILADAGMDATRVDFAGSASDVWFGALEEAERQGLLQTVLDVAREEYPSAFDGPSPPHAPATPRSLSRDEVAQVVEIALRHNADRGLLLAWLPHDLVARLPMRESPFDQLLSDVVMLNALPAPEGGEAPIATWLRNLESRVKPFPEARQVRELQRRLSAG